MISSRFSIVVIFLLGIALIPTVIHTFAQSSEDDGLVVRNIAQSLGEFRSTPTIRKDAWIKKNFDANDWIERRYWRNGHKDLLLFVASSLDHKRLYHHPEIALLPGIKFRKLEPTRFQGYPHIPVYILKNENQNKPGLVLYSLIYEKRGIENPYWFQFNSAWDSLFYGRKELTLFFVYDSNILTKTSPEKSLAAKLLIDAIQSFFSQIPQLDDES